MAEPGDHETNPSNLTRRRLLQATASGATLTALAGCEGLTAQTFTAAPAGLDAEGMATFDYQEGTHTPFSETRTRTVAGNDVEITAENHIVTYGVGDERQGETEEDTDGNTQERVPASWQVGGQFGRALGVLATPTIDIGGEQFNPVATDSLQQLLAGPSGQRLLREMDILGSDAEWSHGPARIGRTAAELLASETAVESFYGIAADANGDSQQVLVHLARVTHDGDIVVVGVGQRRTSEPLSGQLEERDDSASQLRKDTDLTDEALNERRRPILDALPHIGRELDIDLSEFPKLRFDGAKLVQTVTGTRVSKGHEETLKILHREPDPPIVADQNAAVLFGLADTDDPPSSPVTVEIERQFANASPITDTFTLTPAEVDDLKFSSRLDLPGEELQEFATDSKSANDLPVFAPRTDLTAIQLHIGRGGGVLGDSLRLVAGSNGDFTVERCRPLRVGFVEVRDGAFGTNYGTDKGYAQQYEASVEVSRKYIEHVFPGDLLAYRFDVPLLGETNSGEKHLSKDHLDGNRYAEAALQFQPLFPSKGAFLATPNGETAAEQTLKQSGFDVVILVVPDSGDNYDAIGWDYYMYHGERNVAGLAPNSSSAAVSTREIGNDTTVRFDVATTAAQEAAHHLLPNPYANPKPDDPMAQRRGSRNAERQHNGIHLDHDHARDAHSDYDEDGTKDKPGVDSYGFDLLDGTFTQVGETGFDSNRQFITANSFSPERMDSFMSYSGLPRIWTDARTHRKLIDVLSTSSGGTQSAGSTTESSSSAIEPILSAFGRIDGASLVLEDFTAGGGFPTDGDDSGSVTIELRDPSGAVVAEQSVAAVTEVTHLGPVSGAFGVQMPFPETAVTIEVSGADGLESARRNPIVGSLRDAVDRVPEGGFTDTSTRQRLYDQFETVDELMADGAFDEAADVVSADIVSILEATETTYEPALNRPPKSVLRDLVTRMGDRLTTLAAGDW